MEKAFKGKTRMILHLEAAGVITLEKKFRKGQNPEMQYNQSGWIFSIA